VPQHQAQSIKVSYFLGFFSLDFDAVPGWSTRLYCITRPDFPAQF
jgi:hypothetical protein